MPPSLVEEGEFAPFLIDFDLCFPTLLQRLVTMVNFLRGSSHKMENHSRQSANNPGGSIKKGLIQAESKNH